MQHDTAKHARNGNRNDPSFGASVRMFDPTKADEVDRDAAKILNRAAVATGLPRSEVDRTLESTWRRAEPVKPERAQREALPEKGDLDFLTIGDLRDMPPPKWLIPNILPEGLTTLYGEPKVGKTFVALDWSLSLAATGKRVVYCLGEGFKGFHRRIDGWMAKHPGHDPAENFLLLGGGAFPRFLEDHSVTRFKRNIAGLAERGEAPDLVVVDT